jgi:hypothetical protein
MRKTVILICLVAVLAVCLSCKQDYTSTVTNNSECTVKAVISSGETLTLSPGKSDEIERGDYVREFTATPARASMRMAGDDYEFYDTPPIDLVIYNTRSEPVTLYHFESIGNPPESESPISITADSKNDTYKIYNAEPDLSASRSKTVGGDTIEVPVYVMYELKDDTMTVIIY